LREYVEVLAVIGALTLGVGFTPLNPHSLGHVYLLAVILLCVRMGPGPVLLAALSSALAWDYFFIPPRFSFELLDYDDSMLLGIYFAVAIIAGQLTARIRLQERRERRRQRQATALYQLTRALAGGQALDESLTAAAIQAEELFDARVAIFVVRIDGAPVVRAAGSLLLTEPERQIVAWVRENGREAGRGTEKFPSVGGLYIPMCWAGVTPGVLVIEIARGGAAPSRDQRVLMDTFAAQIAMLVERDQLRAAAEREKLLAESDRLHRTLFDSVSHELKTPLAILRSAGEQMSTIDDAKRARLTAEVRTATKRLDHLVGNLLNQTRLESGTLKPVLDWCDVRDVINAGRWLVGEVLAGRPFAVEIPPDLPLLLADAALMEQVLANLLHNAAVYTPVGEPIAITAGLDVSGEHWRIFIRITDRGAGLSPEMKTNLFQKFTRGRGVRPGGLGLGLSIVRGFMHAQGGEVTVADNPGGGTSFTVFLPYTAHGSVPDDEC
jgi:two-component system sensor histidine kinase KdpD